MTDLAMKAYQPVPVLKIKTKHLIYRAFFYFFCVLFSECENLIRRMLVQDPSKRFSISQIKKHKWMQSEEGQPKSSPPSPMMGINAKLGEFNEQILRLMQSLGIDQQKTKEVGISVS